MEVTQVEEYFTVEEVAAKLKVTPQSVYRWIWSERLTAVKPGGIVRILSSDLDKFINGETNDRTE